MDQLTEAASVSVAATEETPLLEAQKDWQRVEKELIKANPKIEKGEIGQMIDWLQEINELEPTYEKLSDEELKNKTRKWRFRITTRTIEARVRYETLSRRVARTFDTNLRRQYEYQLKEAQRELDRQEQTFLDELLPQAFAAVREAARRTIGMRHYDVQLLGGMILHKDMVAEMRTGEGKTLAATLPLYLQALLGHGAHLVTVNDYLAKRDTQWMGPVYKALGMSVGVIQSSGGGHPDQASYRFNPDYKAQDDRYHHLQPVTRKQAYQGEITYGTNNEFGFDYLRDNMVFLPEQRVQRESHFAVVDEVDNVLIDEARTPLIVTGQGEEPSPYFRTCIDIAQRLKRTTNQDEKGEDPNGDFVVDEKTRTVVLTEAGVEKITQMLKIDDLYGPKGMPLLPFLDNALRALYVYQSPRDYLVQKGQVIIVDEFTGRQLPGRRFSEGLHEAIEAKEGVPIQKGSVTLATITFQNFFRMYPHLSGMTGTAKEGTTEEELYKVYKLGVMVLPTNVEFRALLGELEKKITKERWDGEEVLKVNYVNPRTGEQYSQRIDYDDAVYKDPEIKWRKIVEEIKECFTHKRPVLIGTGSIEASEHLSRLLRQARIAHQVLNAKNHEREAAIIAQAGQLGAVTISTQMAGRGVDILLGGNPEGIARDNLRRQGKDLTMVAPEEWQEALRQAQEDCARQREVVLTLGGLHVIGTERHESRRIDNQLRGRAGRQGDPGSSRFFLSLEDDLMRRFAGQRVASLMELLRFPEDKPIDSKMVSHSIQGVQQRAEGYNFDMRKHLLEFDDLLNRQRGLIYEDRQRVLMAEGGKLRTIMWGMIREEIHGLCEEHLSQGVGGKNLQGLYKVANEGLPLPIPAGLTTLHGLNREEIEQLMFEAAGRAYKRKRAEVEATGMSMPELERIVIFKILDNYWTKHLTRVDQLREGIGLRAFGQIDPLAAFKKEGSELFKEMIKDIRSEIARSIFWAQVVPSRVPPPPPPVLK